MNDTDPVCTRSRVCGNEVVPDCTRSCLNVFITDSTRSPSCANEIDPSGAEGIVAEDDSAHDHFETGTPDGISLLEIIDLIEGKCGMSTHKGDWQQWICSLRQLCHCVDFHADVFENQYARNALAMQELDRSVSKIALKPAAPHCKGRNSGSARKRFAALRDTAGSYVGSDVLRALLLVRVHDATNWSLNKRY